MKNASSVFVKLSFPESSLPEQSASFLKEFCSKHEGSPLLRTDGVKPVNVFDRLSRGSGGGSSAEARLNKLIIRENKNRANLS